MSRRNTSREARDGRAVNHNRPQGKEARMRSLAKGLRLRVQGVNSIYTGDFEDCDEITLFRNSPGGRWRFVLRITYARYGEAEPCVVSADFEHRTSGGELIESIGCNNSRPGRVMSSFLTWTEQQMNLAPSSNTAV